MSIVWRNLTVVMCAMGLAFTAPPQAAHAQDSPNAHVRAYAKKLEQSRDAERAHHQMNLKLMREALAALPADEQQQASLVAFGVPALSSIKRLPDTLPQDGMAGRLIPAVAARGEYVPLSFVVAPFKDIPKLEVRTADLVSKNNRIDADRVDVKVVKVWYQTGTAWHSYFADATHRVLVPELLLNDENLIRVDHETQDNYLRVDYPQGSEYVWISAPPDIDDGYFNHETEPVADHQTLQPVNVIAGQSRQFWVTVHVPADAAAGVYQSHLELLDDGKVITRLPLTLRVLPFELPMPSTYYDLDKPFYVMIYNNATLEAHLERNGGDMEQAKAKLRAELTNMRQHNVLNHLLRGKRALTPAYEEQLAIELEMTRDAGFIPPLFNGFSASGSVFFPMDRNPVRFQKYLDEARKVMGKLKETLGHSDVYMFGFDEPGMTILLNQQDGWKELQRMGAKIYSTSKDTHYPVVGFAENVANYSGNISREAAIKWNMIDQRIMNYAGPHTGPENPEFNRRFHGLQLYKAMYGGSGNYKYYDQHKIWNDFSSIGFRGFNMVYPTRTGVIDTMAWEGFRTGIDDIRYATLLKQLAREAIATNEVEAVHAARKALMWLELADAKHDDLQAMRMEMVNYILELRQLLGKDDN